MPTGRTRSEYRLAAPLVPAATLVDALTIRLIERGDRVAAAQLLLSAYRGTIDDEGEDDEAALDAIDHYFTHIIWPSSFVVLDGMQLVAMSLVVIVDEHHYIDPVATASSQKGRGIGRAAVTESLRSLASTGVADVGATITDGNTASARPCARPRAARVRAWVGARRF